MTQNVVHEAYEVPVGNVHVLHSMLTRDDKTVLPWSLLAVLCLAVLQTSFFLRRKPWAKSPRGVWALQPARITDCRIGAPVVLLLYRFASFCYCLCIGLEQLSRIGPRCLKFYTNWNWWLLTAFFLLAAAASLRALLRGGQQPRVARGLDWLEHTIVTLWHMNLTTVLIVDVIAWCVMWPMLRDDPDPIKAAFWQRQLFNWTSYNQHGINAALIYAEMLIDRIPSELYMLGWVGSLSILYGVWAVVYFRCSGEWLYPFLNASKPWAPLAYIGLLLTHWAFFFLAHCIVTARDALVARLARGVKVDVDGVAAAARPAVAAARKVQ